jgi:selenocysteine lyase/cysteine desulfurase
LIDVARVRAETPSVHNVLHLNNAGASLMPEPVFDAVEGHLRLERELGGYEAEDAQAADLADLYPSIGRLLNASTDEIAFIENATRAWDMAFYAVPFKAGDVILTAEAEYASNYIAYLQMTKLRQVRVETIPSDDKGQIDVAALEERLARGGVRLVAVTHVPTQSGLVNPAEAVGRVARRHGVLYLLDACQSVGQMPLDVERIGCDMLSGTGRKFLRGPRGTGFLYVRRSILEELEPPFLDLHAATWTTPDRYEVRPDARRFENWESYVAGRLGLRAAVRYGLDLGMQNIWSRVRGLGMKLRAALAEVPGVAVRDQGAELCGIVTFTKEGEEPGAIRARLSASRINVTTSTIASSRLDPRWRSTGTVVRASIHYYNTEEEIGRFCRVLATAPAS